MEKYQCKNVVSCQTSVNLSRHTLLKWILDDIGVKVEKVEDLCSGAVYCQFMNNIFPGCVPLKKIKFEAKLPTEYWSNLKQLQKAFQVVGCEKDVPITRLLEGRFQENFEFLQWFKRFYDANLKLQEEVFTENTLTSSRRAVSQYSSSRVHNRLFSDDLNSSLNNNQEEILLRNEIEKCAKGAKSLQAEKDFYYNKLRRIEILCQANDDGSAEKKEFVAKILAKLWEEDGEEEY